MRGLLVRELRCGRRVSLLARRRPGSRGVDWRFIFGIGRAARYPRPPEHAEEARERATYDCEGACRRVAECHQNHAQGEHTQEGNQIDPLTGAWRVWELMHWIFLPEVRVGAVS
jgi:hypothetical protein